MGTAPERPTGGRGGQSDDRRGRQAGEIYDVVKNGAPPDMFMAPFDSQISSTDIWNLVNYLRSLGPKK